MNKNFSEWLIASDIDGTMNSKLRRLPERNRKAVKRFIENGGNFTLASGRPVRSLEREYKMVKPNCPAVVLNGAGIYDFGKKEMVWKKTIDERGRNFVKSIQKKFSTAVNRVEVAVFFEDKAYITRSGVLSWFQLTFDRAVREVGNIDEIPQEGWLMVIFWGSPWVISAIEKSVTSEDRKYMNCMQSSPVSFNILGAGVHKGTAIMQLADMLGVSRQNVGAIGDYYNDLDMLQTVAVPACAGQAPKALRKICTYVSCHCNKGCVADFLGFVERERMTYIKA